MVHIYMNSRDNILHQQNDNILLHFVCRDVVLYS